jgi:hypothetical protein
VEGIGAIGVVGAIFLFLALRPLTPRRVLYLRTAGGETATLSARSGDQLTEIKTAIEAALATREGQR